MGRSISDFRVGDFVQSAKDFPDQPFVGAVSGISVNSSGEPVLVLEMTVRKNDKTSLMMVNLGFVAVRGTSETFWKRTGNMFPANAEPIERLTNL